MILAATIAIVAVVLALGVMLRLDRQVRASLAYAENLPAGEGDLPVSIIKPVYGVDAYTAENFRSWAEQDYPGPVQLVFSFQRPDDPAIPLAQPFVAAGDAEIIVHPVAEGYSGKMSNLRHGQARARHEFLIFSDSDIRAQPQVLRQLVALHTQGVDLVSCLMRHKHAGNLWARIFAAFWNFEHMAFIAPAILQHGRDATGGTMAMRGKTLAQLGGLEAFRDYVAEDVAMGRRAHELGLRVGLGPVVDSPVGEMSLRALLNKFARAALFGASMNAVGESVQYGVLFSYLILLPLGLGLGSWPLVAAGLLIACLRLVFATRLWRLSTGERRLFFEIFVSDAVFLFAYGRALLTRKLEWGGMTYRVGADGRMEQVERRESG